MSVIPFSAVPQGAPENDPLIANVVWAQAPTIGKFIRLAANPETVRLMRGDHLNSAIGQYCGLIHGALVSGDGTPGLVSAVALYRGIKRPMTDVNLDGEIYAYILNPRFTYTFPDPYGKPVKRPAPTRAVFVAYADFGATAIESAARHLGQDVGQVNGVIHYWEWVLASEENARLPDGYGRRYQEKVWGP